MATVRFSSSDIERIDDAIDYLREHQFEILTSETDDPAELTAFYLSRMNAKLDNLGQLRHIRDLTKEVSRLRQSLREQQNKEQEKRNVRGTLNRALFDHLMEERPVKPTIPNYFFEHLTYEDISVILGNGLFVEK